MLPGERGDRLSTARLTSGRLPLEANLWAQLQEVAARGPTGATPPARQADGTSTATAPAAAVAAPLLAPTGPATWKMATRLQHPVTKNEDPYAGESARGVLRRCSALRAQADTAACAHLQLCRRRCIRRPRLTSPARPRLACAWPVSTGMGAALWSALAAACIRLSLTLLPRRYDYTRSGNPTRALLEGHMAELEARNRAEHACGSAVGLSAADARSADSLLLTGRGPRVCVHVRHGSADGRHAPAAQRAARAVRRRYLWCVSGKRAHSCRVVDFVA
jgi:hypothetical protein